jgi:arylsulfatase A-like enzyme
MIHTIAGPRIALLLVSVVLLLCSGPVQTRQAPPNILIVIADDWSYPHASAYGDPTVSTPAFDRVAREGALFRRAFAVAPSCTPSRAALLTGLLPHQLAEGGNLWGFLPSRFEVYPDLLEKAGYVVGHSGKGWGPGQFEAGGRSRNPAGPRFESLDAFLATRRAGQPFSFWYGSTDPHRPYDAGSGESAGLAAASVRVPPFLPDSSVVRSDLLDYYFEVQRFDRQLASLLEALERRNELDNTIVVVTSDNGMPFPRAKANLYDAGTHVPLAIRWPRRVKRGVTIDAFVNLSDLAPTFTEAAGIAGPPNAAGTSLWPLLDGKASLAARNRTFTERERHANVRSGDLSYPARAIRTDEFLYIRNYRPDRWPAGDPQQYVAVGPFGDIDGGPSKTLLLDRRNEDAISRYFDLATAKRPAEELFDLKKDPNQLINVAGNAAYAKVLERLRTDLTAWQRDTRDPRVSQDDDRWDKYPYFGAPAKK